MELIYNRNSKALEPHQQQITALLPTLSPNSLHPQFSFQCVFIPTRKNSAQPLKCRCFNSLTFKTALSLNLLSRAVSVLIFILVSGTVPI